MQTLRRFLFHVNRTETRGFYFMSEESTPQETQDNQLTDTQPETQEGSEQRFTQADIDRIVQDRLSRQKAKYEADTQKAKEEAERAQLEEQNKFKELYTTAQSQVEDLTAYKTKYQEILDSTAERNKTRIEAIPEDMRGLVPDYSDSLKLAAWLDDNQELLTPKQSKAPSLNGGAGNGVRRDTSIKYTDGQIKEMAARFGVPEKAMRKSLQAQGASLGD